jgi:recombination protein RecA
MDIINKSGSWYSYEGTKIAQGRDAAKQFFLDNPELAEEIELKIKAKLMPARVHDKAGKQSEEKVEETAE